MDLRSVSQEQAGQTPWRSGAFLAYIVPRNAPHFSDRTAFVCPCCLSPSPMREASALRKTRNQFPSSFPKRGTHSVGVKRQWCGHRGKVDNCQVGVFMGYVSDQEHALLDFRLSLPEEWVRDEPRRQACHVPKEVRYHTRHEQCLEMLDAWGDQVAHGWVTGDDELGRHTRFRHELRERGERSVLGVPCMHHHDA